MIELQGIHFLLTYQCTFECDHCFLFGSPFAPGVFTIENLHKVLYQTKQLATVKNIYFEGGEPFLYFPLMVEGIRCSLEMGFKVGIVTNGYWATSVPDAKIWLQYLKGFPISDLSISDDELHYANPSENFAKNALKAAQELNLKVSTITIAKPSICITEENGRRGEKIVDGDVVFRGRAVEKLLQGVKLQPACNFNECTQEDFINPSRVHIDPFGNVHLCQGLLMGNLFQVPLKQMIESYDPYSHPITAPILKGGPLELARRNRIIIDKGYADACHLCYDIRKKLKDKYPQFLAPDWIYGQ